MMKCLFGLLIATLVFVGSETVGFGQVRTGRGGGGQPAAAGQTQQPPPANGSTAASREDPPQASDPRFTSRLRFTPRRSDEELTGDRARRGVGPGRAGTVWFSPWTGAVPAQADAATMALLDSPSYSPPGGLQLDVQPWRAQVYADGIHVGAVSEFSGYYHHLDLAPGPHVIAIVASEYVPLVFEVMVSSGRTTTYRGTLTRAPGP